MKLKKLISSLKVKKIIGNVDIDITEIFIDSKSVTKNSLFVCIKGKRIDSHSLIKQVENFGAVAVITESKLDTSLTQIIVEDCRLALALVSAEYYGNVYEKMKIVGVVGTNGKTTTSHVIKNVLQKNGIKCGVIGTIGSYYTGKKIENNLTTPDPLELHKILKDMYDNGVEIVIMEVSAHAIALKKVENIKFEVGIFTNFSQDHLDYFSSMEEYKNVKKSFFKNCKCIIANSDDEVGLEIIKENKGVISYGINNPSDVFAINLKCRLLNTSFVVNLFDQVYNVNTTLMGEFNVYNLLCSMTVCSILGVKLENVVKYTSEIEGVSGRLELISAKKPYVFIDYAHTPDGLENVLKTLKSLTKARVICVFGCGGNRDCGKRAKMGEISGKFADFTVITSDNPRFEEPMDIIYEIEKGILKETKNYVVVQDRVEGIKYALSVAQKNDIVLVAGKGCENYQEVLGIKHVYNDKTTIENLLKI
ncbi:MAG: UDP-N-acetylmuramoyl-L-alanyl-D-glutamate--2,6-diaminopimelate ligase [Clostridia bacterium]|nr:UDP-N-acetylmuramoyl-L-alanyl-D-glutamate--2,6-diaminopimelate ligase [Clostridia bacterium]